MNQKQTSRGFPLQDLIISHLGNRPTLILA